MSLQLTPAWYHKHKTKWPCAAGVWDKLRDWTETHVPALVTPTWPTTKMISLFCFQPTAHMSSMGYQLPTNRKTEQLPTSPATEQQQHATLKHWCLASLIFWLTGGCQNWKGCCTHKVMASCQLPHHCQSPVMACTFLLALRWDVVSAHPCIQSFPWHSHLALIYPLPWSSTCSWPTSS